MIPTLLLVGLVVGALVHDRASFVWCSTVLVVLAFAWGIVVGAADAAVSTFVGGTAIAFANLATAASISALVRNTRRWHAGQHATNPN